MPSSHDAVLDFINRRFPDSCDNNHWLSGNCFYFSIILHTRFPDSFIVYDVISGHFLTLIDVSLYDASGLAYQLNESEFVELNITKNKAILLENSMRIVLWDYFDDYDSIQKKRIERDCVE
jgi:hypothetical protein